MKHIFYIGTYTQGKPDEPERKEGIWIYSLDTGSGKLHQIGGVESGSNPAYLCMSSDGQYLYAGNELMESQASAFRVRPQDGSLTFLNREPTLGQHSCHVSLDPGGRWLMVSNYSSGTLTILPVREDGSLGPLTDLVNHAGSGLDPARQEHAHAHSTRCDPTHQYILAADLGIDRVLVYRLDAVQGKLRLHDGASGAAKPGAGPRHMEWHTGGKILYVANELDSTVAVYAWDADQGRLAPLQVLTTLPKAYSGVENAVADIHLTPDGRYLYVSNRGDNSLAAYRVDPSTGLLEQAGWYSTGGNWPRNFAIHREGKYLLAANQYSGNVVVFEIQDDGSLTRTGEETAIPAPVCILFAP